VDSSSRAVRLCVIKYHCSEEGVLASDLEKRTLIFFEVVAKASNYTYIINTVTIMAKWCVIESEIQIQTIYTVIILVIGIKY
jgi:hypothetical protein